MKGLLLANTIDRLRHYLAMNRISPNGDCMISWWLLANPDSQQTVDDDDSDGR